MAENENEKPDKQQSLALFVIIVLVVLAVLFIEWLLGLISNIFR
jgi:hypothetical protein